MAEQTGKVFRVSVIVGLWLGVVYCLWAAGPSDPNTRRQAAWWVAGLAAVSATGLGIIAWRGKEHP